MTRSPGARYRKPGAAVAPRVAELDPAVEAGIEESLAWARQGHQMLHEACAELQAALSSGQVSIVETARRRLLDAVKASASALAQL